MSLTTLSKWGQFANFWNRRVICTPAVKSAIYFAIAIVACLLFYFLILQRPM